MSIDSLLSDISRCSKEIAYLEGQRAKYSKDRADALGKSAEAQKSAMSSSNPSTQQSKLRDAQRYQEDAARAASNEASVAGKIADQSKRMADYQERLGKEQSSQARKQQDSFKRFEESLQQQRRASEQSADGTFGRFYRTRTTYIPREEAMAAPEEVSPPPQHDAFISHASEDKEEIVRPLADALTARGLSVWYDDFRLTVGDSLRRSIDRGLSQSRFGIVILSEAFFNKEWPQRELDGLVAREAAGGKVILPIWHKITKDRVLHYSPTLADKLALNTSNYTVSEIVDKLADVLAPQRVIEEQPDDTPGNKVV